MTAVPNTTIEASPYNQNTADVGSGLTDSLSRSGKGGMQADLAMGNNKITNLDDGTSTNDAVNYGQVFFGAGWTPEEAVASATTCDILGAASNFIEITGTTTITSLGTGTSKFRVVRFSGALTLTHNATSLILPGGANIITQAGDTMIVESDASSNARVVTYMSAANATTFGLGAITVASATTTNILGANSPLIAISGTTTITSFGTGPNRVRFVNFTGALLLTHNATTLILPGGANITTASGDTCIVVSDASSNARVLAYQRSAGTSAVPTSPPPLGRLTLTSGTPVLTGDVTAATAVYYTPYLGATIPMWNGVAWLATAFSELTLTLNSSAQVSGSNYDIFIVDDAGTMRLVTGPAWSTNTGRGTGAGTTQLSYNAGFLANTVSMTAKYSASSITVAAGYGLYVGTMRASANGQTEMTFLPSAAAGGTANKLYLWNMYNRVQASSVSRDSTNSWTYTTATFHEANSGATGSGLNNRVSVVRGLNEDVVSCTYSVPVTSDGGGNFVSVGVGLDSTSATTYPASRVVSSSLIDTATATYVGAAGLGFHFFQALEYSVAVNTTTWYGDNNAPTLYQMALSLQTMV